jgi:hypothetical protein
MNYGKSRKRALKSGLGALALLAGTAGLALAAGRNSGGVDTTGWNDPHKPFQHNSAPSSSLPSSVTC